MEKFITHIHPPKGVSLGLRELWQYRELFYFFTWRDIKVKYKQTYLGIIWALLQPLGMMLIFTFLFSKTWPINTGTIQYPVFVLSGLILWNLINSAVSDSQFLIALASDNGLPILSNSLFNGNSIVEQALIEKEKMVMNTITYRLGHFILYPFKLIRDILKK